MVCYTMFLLKKILFISVLLFLAMVVAGLTGKIAPRNFLKGGIFVTFTFKKRTISCYVQRIEKSIQVLKKNSHLLAILKKLDSFVAIGS